MKLRKNTATRALALAAISLLALTGCTNTEGAATDGSGASSESGLGAGGNAAAAAVAVDPAVAALVPQKYQDAGVLNLVTDPTYAPVVFTDDAGTIVGLEPDLALAVANKMGLKIDIAKGDFNGILAGLESRRYDASWAAFSITADRVAKIDMVSYMQGGTSVMVAAGKAADIAKVEDLCGKTLAVQTGTTQALNVMPMFEQTCADAGLEAITPLVVPQQDSANQAVSSGRADAMIADQALVAYYAQVQPEVYESVDAIFVDPSVVGVAMPKGDDSLAPAFQAAIQSLMDDGTYQTILDAWAMGPAAIPTSEINPDTTVQE